MRRPAGRQQGLCPRHTARPGGGLHEPSLRPPPRCAVDTSDLARQRGLTRLTFISAGAEQARDQGSSISGEIPYLLSGAEREKHCLADGAQNAVTSSVQQVELTVGQQCRVGGTQRPQHPVLCLSLLLPSLPPAVHGWERVLGFVTDSLGWEAPVDQSLCRREFLR
ncbi:hypothetical protein AAFF_G00077170 [Aldrovandia affinis]|uniref:Uncharacterized protein n=1 Tax=Aldrovandia affinis TaxID=143900 RepID=A0AAD7WD48_9TELE|nr:hypothetical protein AAFF_G00077170 [Aldrovandia affinis]